MINNNIIIGLNKEDKEHRQQTVEKVIDLVIKEELDFLELKEFFLTKKENLSSSIIQIGCRTGNAGTILNWLEEYCLIYFDKYNFTSINVQPLSKVRVFLALNKYFSFDKDFHTLLAYLKSLYIRVVDTRETILITILTEYPDFKWYMCKWIPKEDLVINKITAYADYSIEDEIWFEKEAKLLDKVNEPFKFLNYYNIMIDFFLHVFHKFEINDVLWVRDSGQILDFVSPDALIKNRQLFYKYEELESSEIYLRMQIPSMSLQEMLEHIKKEPDWYKRCNLNGYINHENSIMLHILLCNGDLEAFSKIEEIIFYFDKTDQAMSYFDNTKQVLHNKLERMLHNFYQIIARENSNADKRRKQKFALGQKWENLCYKIALHLYPEEEHTIKPLLRNGKIPDLAIGSPIKDKYFPLLIEFKTTPYFIQEDPKADLFKNTIVEKYKASSDRLEFWVLTANYKMDEVLTRGKVTYRFANDILLSENLPKRLEKQVLNLINKYISEHEEYELFPPNYQIIIDNFYRLIEILRSNKQRLEQKEMKEVI